MSDQEFSRFVSALLLLLTVLYTGISLFNLIKALRERHDGRALTWSILLSLTFFSALYHLLKILDHSTLVSYSIP